MRKRESFRLVPVSRVIGRCLEAGAFHPKSPRHGHRNGYASGVRKLAPVLVLAVLGWGCSPSRAESGPTDTDASTSEATVETTEPTEAGSESESGSSGDDLPNPDLPEECENIGGKALSLESAVWQLDADARIAQTLVLGGSASVAVGSAGDTWELYEVDLNTGAAEMGEFDLFGDSFQQLFRSTDAQLLYVEANGHDIGVQRIDGTNLVDVVHLEDDHPRVGWNGGGSGVMMVDPKADGFVALGTSFGDETPEGGARDVVWAKSYDYGAPENKGTLFQWEERDAKNKHAGVWSGGDAIFADGESIVRVSSDGAEVWRADQQTDYLYFLDVSAETALWRYGAPSGLHDGFYSVDAIGRHGLGNEADLQVLWQDNHCDRRFASGGFVPGGEHFVVVASAAGDGGPTDWNSWVHLVSEDGEVEETLRLELPDGYTLVSGLPFETEGGEVGVLMAGRREDDGIRGFAAAFVPFE